MSRAPQAGPSSSPVHAALASTRLFADASAPVIDRIRRGALVQTFAPQTLLLSQGERAAHLHIALTGRIGLIGRANDGRETVVEVFEAGDVFIAPAVILDAPYLMSARVLREARILMVEAEHFRRCLAADHVLTTAMMRELAGHWRLLVQQIKDLKLRRASQRLAAYLLALSGGGAGEVALPEERQVMAARLGMTPESLSRAFAELRAEGVSGRGRRVAIADAARLQAFSAFEDVV
jgi:CRP/FNR family transcriptional regulator, transcriptional activator FtrB